MSFRWVSFVTYPSCIFMTVTSPLRESDRVSCACNFSWRTGREDVLHSGVRGEHLAHKLLLLFPEVVLQVVRQHHVAGLLHGHHLAEHLQLWPKHSQEQRSVSGNWKLIAYHHVALRRASLALFRSCKAQAEYNKPRDLLPHSVNLLYNWRSLWRRSPSPPSWRNGIEII